MDDISSYINRHVWSTEVSVEEHVQKVIINLGRELKKKHSIYLDINFWLLLRDQSSQPAKRLFEVLCEAVELNLLFCPISNTTFFELIKNAKQLEREKVAHCVDMLSLGVGIVSENERVCIELNHFIRTCLGRKVVPVNYLVWRGVGLAVGGPLYPRSVPPFLRFDPHTLQKAFFDKMWETPMIEVMHRFSGWVLPEEADAAPIASILNAIKSQGGKFSSFNKYYLDEAKAICDRWKFQPSQILDKINNVAPRAPDTLPPDEVNFWANLMFHFLKKRERSFELRTMRTIAAIHAATRWDANKKIKTNDVLDYEHAVAAICYCSAFFTDNPTKILLTQGNTKLDKKCSCVVISDIQGAISYIEKLLEDSSVNNVSRPKGSL